MFSRQLAENTVVNQTFKAVTREFQNRHHSVDQHSEAHCMVPALSTKSTQLWTGASLSKLASTLQLPALSWPSYPIFDPDLGFLFSLSLYLNFW